jgi:hypothetical protein
MDGFSKKKASQVDHHLDIAGIEEALHSAMTVVK